MNTRIYLTCFFASLMFFTVDVQAQQNQADKIKSFLQKYHEYGLFNGAALVAKDGEIILKEGFGEANMSWNIPNTPQTKFRISSTTKQFTAAIILTLVEDGLLELDGKITNYLPDYPKDQGGQITIHQLLTHTSGIPSYTSPVFMSDQVRDPFEPDSLVALFSDLELQFEPGTRWTYSNSGYVLLGKIIEAVTGKSYDQFLREQLLDPFELNHTGYDHFASVIQGKASGYIQTPSGYEHAPYLDTTVPYSAGMLYSTIEDLYKWDQLLYGQGPFENPSTKSLLFDQHIPLPEGLPAQANLPPYYGYGWFTGPVPIADDTVQVVEHGGNIFGFSTGFWRIPDDRNTIILLDNSSTDKIREIGKGVKLILYGRTPPDPKQQVSSVMYNLIAKNGFDAAKTHYQEISESDSDRYDLSESQLNILGYYYLNNDRIETAIEVFKLNAERFQNRQMFTIVWVRLI